MAYAGEADITTLYGETALFVADRDGDGAADSDVIARALGSATAEIDSLIGVRYALPLPEAPAILVQFCVDIALYRMASWRDALSEDIRTRYEDAIAALKRIGKGEQSLGLAEPDGGGEGEAGSGGPRPIIGEGPPRLFARTTMRNL